MLETTGPVNCLAVELGTRSKRNFHRPESNCGVAINSVCEVFMLLSQASEVRHFGKSEILQLPQGAKGPKKTDTSTVLMGGDDGSVLEFGLC